MTLNDLLRERNSFLGEIGDKFTNLDDIEHFEGIDLAIKKEEFKLRKGYRILRGFYKSPEYKRFLKSAQQRRRRFKTRVLERVGEGDFENVELLKQSLFRPFWLELWPSRASTAFEFLDSVRGLDFVGQIRVIDTDGNLILYERSNTEYTLFVQMKRLYKKLEDIKKNVKKSTNQTEIFQTSTSLFRFQELLILDIETIIPTGLVQFL